MKKVLATLLALCMMIGCVAMLSACTPSTPDVKEPVEIRVWAPDAVVELTQTKLDAWLATLGEDYAHYTIVVSAMGEGDAATQMLTDVEAGADVFGFAQDQLARLVAAGALSPLGGTFLTDVQTNNDGGSVAAATLDGVTYAYPETSDNGYFMYYDSSVITDTSSIEAVLDQCAAAGKKFHMDIQSGWYNISHFFGAGAYVTYNVDSEGNISGCNCDFESDAALDAFKGLIALASHEAFVQNGGPDSSVLNPEGGDAAVLVSGTWHSSDAANFLGENYAACKLPTFTVGENTYQMGGFGGFKLVGVKPQADSDKLTFCHMIAAYLTGEEMQTARFEANGWGPSNLNAQKLEGVASNPALSALAEQLNYTIGQGQYPQAYWDLMAAFGTDINSGMYDNASDDELKAALSDLAAELKAAK